MVVGDVRYWIGYRIDVGVQFRDRNVNVESKGRMTESGD